MQSTSVGCAGPSARYGGPTSQITGLKGSVANVFVPESPLHLQRFIGLYESDLIWQRKGNLNNIRQEGLILWLISVYKMRGNLDS